MSTILEGEAAFRHGAHRVPTMAVHNTPLGYNRASIPVGNALPVPPAMDLADRLRTCSVLDIVFDGKLGDSLLALAAVRAVTDWLNLQDGGTEVRARGAYADLIARSGLLAPDPRPECDGPRAVVGDRSAVEARASAAAVGMVCDPAAAPCWSSDDRAHPDLPARYYLALERRLGLRLPGTAPFLPLLSSRPNEWVDRLRADGWLSGLTVAAITATSWPERKDYTAGLFVQVAQHIAKAHSAPLQLLLIGGDTGRGLRLHTVPARRDVQVLHIDGAPADQLADLFPHCQLVVGNDTGLTHLAAMARSPDGNGPPVIGLYARHSHSKWRTGLPHHHAVATPLSDRMHQGDLCPVRDVITSDADPHMDAFPPASVAQACLDVLTGSL